MDAINLSSPTSSIGGIDTHDKQRRSAPHLWQNPHVIGAIVLEDSLGKLYLLFKHYGLNAWARRVTWRYGIDRLLPVDHAHSPALDELGYRDSY